ncbi:hypothetical protein DY000_02031034 [Brassica cretica]|uniref:Uncharacterized protein n=1 Tax=Brassica cretica TaxID=69181 RepID=A0ABQ7DPV5_BRACR|nr:hypothetical protein DY000_02031034 [Brassica cretica]
MVRGNVPASLRTLRQAFHGQERRSDRLLKPSGLSLRLTRPIGSRPKAGSGKGVRWAIELDFMGRSNLDSIRLDGLDTIDRFIFFMFMLTEELRMVMVKPRSREGSVGERLCNVWLDDARDELVIVYETVKKLCIGSHVSKLEKVRKSKRTAGQSSQGAADGANLSGSPNDPVATNTGDVFPTDQANLTGTQQDGQLHEEHEEEVESSNANRDGDQREKVADGTANVHTALSREDLLEAMKVMGNHVAVMTQLFTPLVNSSVGQATPHGLLEKVSGHSRLPQMMCTVGDWTSPDPVPKSEFESGSR